ncbi:hypothetical protein EJD97_019409 [Solanum chilense]|uniref:Uncharacterized protein n=1 Tax=Solanum chilense TaxID=4083 RepID=A0A6N2C6T5_SOLCI|nr:hypothetical protein EJD97_019409 [Solanum chilense]
MTTASISHSNPKGKEKEKEHEKKQDQEKEKVKIKQKRKRIKSLALLKGLVYLVDCFSTSLRTNKICALRFKIHCCQSILSSFFIKKTEPTGQFLSLTKERTNITHAKSKMILVFHNKQALVCKYHITFFSYHY